MTRRVLAIGGVLLLFVLAGLTVWAGWLINTEAGLHFVLRRLETLSAVSITASGARGTIGGPLEFDTLVIDHEAVRIDARELRLQPELSNLLSRTISIASAEAGTLEVTLRSRGPQPPSEPHFMPHPLRLLVGRFDLQARRARPRQRSAVLRRLDQRGAHDGPLGAARPCRHDQGRCGRAGGCGAPARGSADGRDRYAFRALAAAGRPRLSVLERGARQSRSAGNRRTTGATRSSQLLGQRARPDRRAAGARDAPCHRIRRLTLGSRGALPARERLDRDQRGAQLDRSRRHAHLDRARRRAAAPAGRRNMAGPCHRDHHASRVVAAQRGVVHDVRDDRSRTRITGARAHAASGRHCAGRSRASRSSQARVGTYRIGGSLPVRLRGEGRDRGCADTSGRLACDGTGRPRCPHDRCRRRVHAGRAHPRRRPPGVDRRPALAIHRASPLARSSRAPRGSRRTHRLSKARSRDAVLARTHR